MKEAETNSAGEGVVIEAPVIDLSIGSPIPSELTKRFASSMGLYDRPEHPFRMYAVAALG